MSDTKRIFASKDLLAGLLYAAIGAGFAIIGSDYGLGTTRRMGPGYFPLMIGSALCLVGLGMILRVALSPQRAADRIPRLYIRPLALLTLSVLAFAATIHSFGLIAACISCVALAGAASSTTRWKEILIVAAIMAAFSGFVFVGFLGLPMRLWNW